MRKFQNQNNTIVGQVEFLGCAIKGKQFIEKLLNRIKANIFLNIFKFSSDWNLQYVLQILPFLLSCNHSLMMDSLQKAYLLLEVENSGSGQVWFGSYWNRVYPTRNPKFPDFRVRVGFRKIFGFLHTLAKRRQSFAFTGNHRNHSAGMFKFAYSYLTSRLKS